MAYGQFLSGIQLVWTHYSINSVFMQLFFYFIQSSFILSLSLSISLSLFSPSLSLSFFSLSLCLCSLSFLSLSLSFLSLSVSLSLLSLSFLSLSLSLSLSQHAHAHTRIHTFIHTYIYVKVNFYVEYCWFEFRIISVTFPGFWGTFQSLQLQLAPPSPTWSSTLSVLWQYLGIYLFAFFYFNSVAHWNDDKFFSARKLALDLIFLTRFCGPYVFQTMGNFIDIIFWVRFLGCA